MKFLKIHKQISIDAAVSGFLGYTECQVTNDAYRKPCNKGDQYLLKQSTLWSFAFDRTECQCVQSSTLIDPVSLEKKILHHSTLCMVIFVRVKKEDF